MSDATVDVIIPVHDPGRPVREAVDSASSEQQGVRTRRIVVVHADDLDAFDTLPEDVLIVHHPPEQTVPGEPRNAGMVVAKARWISFLDSDDLLAPGALRAMVETADRTGASIVLPTIHTTEGWLPTPAVRPFRQGVLDPVLDGLFYRSHVFGLLDRTTLADRGARFDTSLRSGEDLAFMARLHADVPVAVAWKATYELRDVGAQRITRGRPVTERLAIVDHLLQDSELGKLAPRTHPAVLLRLLAVNVARDIRFESNGVLTAEHAAARDAILEREPALRALLSLRDLLDLQLLGGGPMATLAGRSPIGALLPSAPSSAVAELGPVRSGARLAWTRWRARWCGTLTA